MLQNFEHLSKTGRKIVYLTVVYLNLHINELKRFIYSHKLLTYHRNNLQILDQQLYRIFFFFCLPKTDFNKVEKRCLHARSSQ